MKSWSKDITCTAAATTGWSGMAENCWSVLLRIKYNDLQVCNNAVPFHFDFNFCFFFRKTKIHLSKLKTISTFSRAGVQYILDTVTEELEKDENKHFVYVEMSFFQRWYFEQTDIKRSKLTCHNLNQTWPQTCYRASVKKLVHSGQLSFANGGLQSLTACRRIPILTTHDSRRVGHARRSRRALRLHGSSDHPEPCRNLSRNCHNLTRNCNPRSIRPLWAIGFSWKSLDTLPEWAGRLTPSVIR